MYIFYDLETSSRELVGQILTYSFLVVDSKFQIHDELTGSIRLNRIQLPEIDAILTNRINLTDHQKSASSEMEYTAAQKVHTFLSHQVDQHGYIPLVGFNGNSFDLPFLRNLLIRYGFNPYFSGKLTNLDILHYAQHIAFTNPDTFVWQLRENDEGRKYYSFKLEDLAKSFQLLDAKASQTHSAREDVVLTIELAKELQKRYKCPLKTFKSFQLLSRELPVQTSLSIDEKPIVNQEAITIQPDFDVAKQKVRDYPDTDRPPEKFKYLYWLKILNSKKEYIVLNLEQYQSDPPLACLKYINPNKHFFVLEPVTSEEKKKLAPFIEKAKKDSFLQNLTKDKYFELIKKDWDIEYQIHELGFKRIDALKIEVDELLQNPQNYDKTLKTLLENRANQSDRSEKEKDTALIRLYNRVYLNYHPNVKKSELHQYCIPRYITGDLLKNKKDFQCLQEQSNRLNQLLNQKELPKEDWDLLIAYKTYFLEFCFKNYLSLS